MGGKGPKISSWKADDPFYMISKHLVKKSPFLCQEAGHFQFGGEERPLKRWHMDQALNRQIGLLSEGNNVGKGTEPGGMNNKDPKCQAKLWKD